VKCAPRRPDRRRPRQMGGGPRIGRYLRDHGDRVPARRRARPCVGVVRSERRPGCARERRRCSRAACMHGDNRLSRPWVPGLLRLGAARALDGQRLRRARLRDGSGSILRRLSRAVLLVRIQTHPLRRAIPKPQTAPRLLAHSFLAFTPGGDHAQKQVVPLLGFSWGFVIGDHGRVTLTPVRRLTADDWKSHLLHLRRCYPGWKFAAPPSFTP
jgi:hypothetical protein